jgi:leucyl-tRNA synthetase
VDATSESRQPTHQINGKLRANIEVSPAATEEEIKNRLNTTESLDKYLADQDIKKMIYIPGKIVSLVV